MSKKLLIIDDDYDLRTAFVEILEDDLIDFTIIQAVDGLDGLAKIKEFNPEIVICDNQMPNMKGFEVVNQLNVQNLKVNNFFLYTGDVNPPRLTLHGRPVEVWEKPKPIKEILNSINSLHTKAS